MGNDHHAVAQEVVQELTKLAMQEGSDEHTVRTKALERFNGTLQERPRIQHHGTRGPVMRIALPDDCIVWVNVPEHWL